MATGEFNSAVVGKKSREGVNTIQWSCFPTKGAEEILQLLHTTLTIIGFGCKAHFAFLCEFENIKRAG